ncbi:MAG: VTT domain-containing protein [Candidatus ainarchaeum sp.]|nr:VTT domain-containing protein [Candidatus ainarchaeum sp.]
MSKKRAVIQLFFALLITAVILIYGEEIKEYASFGYIGIFIVSLLSSATILIPAPGWLAVLELGRFLDPVLLALFAGSGAAIGELTGYFAGSGLVGMMENNKHLFDKHKEIIQKHGFFAILFLAFIPNPFFDLAGVSAGVLKMDLKIFLSACFLGKILKFLLLAYLGAFSLALL